MFDLVTVGHFAIDLILSSRIAEPKPTLGGPPTYVSLAAKRLNAEVSVVSKVGEDFPDEYVAWLEGNGVDLSGLKRVKGALSTRYVLKYRDEKRRLQLKSRAPPICPSDVQDSLKARAIHVAPIADEISTDVVNKLRASTPILSLDPQGFVRSTDEEGNVRLKRWDKPEVFQQIDVYKSSLNEIRMATGIKNAELAMRKIHDRGARIVIVTRGVEGSLLLFDGEFCRVPACKSRVVKDPTGAGDAFTGAFLAEYVRRKDPEWCACVGSAAASFVVEGIGPAVFGGKEETYGRATEIYERDLRS